ncbi:MAG: transposase family protein [Desulfobacterales bacterium]|nr:transposase family protein [Desulfobacterales bacterium]
MGLAVAEKEIARALDVTPKAVRLRAVKDGWPVMKKTKQGGAELQYIRDLLPVKVKQSLMARDSIVGIPAVIPDLPVPKRSSQIGLAKYNLVHSYRLAKERAGWGQKGQAARDFLLTYNAGMLLPQVFAVVGEVRQKTIEALDKKLRKNQDNYLALCDGRGGWRKHGTNQYKVRAISEAAKATLLKCYLHPHRPSLTMAIKMTRVALEDENMPESASDSTFIRWFKDYEKLNAGVICLAREGMKMYQDKFGPYITRDAGLLEVGQCLVADGKTLNFNILHPETGRPCRMTLIVFFDWASRYPCGWHIMPSEDQYGILSAFRNAVQTLGRYPDAVYLDNGRAFKSKLFTKTDPDFTEMTGLYARVGTAVMFAKPYNGRAKVVERFFKTFQDQLEFMMPSYCGDSIATKPAWMHRNEKFHKAWHEARTSGWVPDIREAGLIIDRYFHWYAQQSHQDLEGTPESLFLPNRGPGVDPIQLNYDFLLRKEVRPRNCRVKLWKIDYEADCLHNLSRTEPIWAAVDTADLRKIWCYTKDGVFLGEAYPVQACHPLAKLFGDQVTVEQVITANKRIARMAKANKKQLAAMGISKDARDSMNILPFSKEKTATLPAPDDSPKAPVAKDEAALPEKEIRRLEDLTKKAEQEDTALPKIPRPKYWRSGLEHYEWCFNYVFKHGRELDPVDAAFMGQFESLPEFDDYRQRFEDLKLIYK